MKKVLLLVSQIIFPSYISAQVQFKQLPWEHPHFAYASTQIFREAGKAHIIISGAIDSDEDGLPDTSKSSLFRDIGDRIIEEKHSGVLPIHSGANILLDIDNDGDLDLVSNGINYADVVHPQFHVYKWQDGKFNISQSLAVGSVFGSLAKGDFDNDGFEDVLLTGSINGEDKTVLFKNYQGELKVFSHQDLVGIKNGQAEFIDIDNDMDLDIILMGLDTQGEKTFNIYENQGAKFSLKQSLPGLSDGSLRVADFDADGYKDIFVLGENADDVRESILYKNLKGTFQEKQKLYGVYNPSGNPQSVAADFDQDGDIDLIYAGSDDNLDDKVLVYLNENGNLSLAASTNINNVGGGISIKAFDREEDGDLDLVLSGFASSKKGYLPSTNIYENTSSLINSKPLPPTEIEIKNLDEDYISLTWNGAYDAETKPKNLSYKVEIGSSKGKAEFLNRIIDTNNLKLKIRKEQIGYIKIYSIDTSELYSDNYFENNLLSTQDTRKDNSVTFNNPIKDGLLTLLGLEIHHIEIFDLNGRKVLERNLHSGVSSHSIDVSKLGSGVYLLKIKYGNQILTKKIIIKNGL